MALWLCLMSMVLGAVVSYALPPAADYRLAALWLAALGAGGLMALTSLYGTAVFAISTVIAREAGKDLWWHLPDVIAAYHFGYGLGSLRGWWDALVRGRPDPAFGRLTR